MDHCGQIVGWEVCCEKNKLGFKNILEKNLLKVPIILVKNGPFGDIA